MCPSSISGDTYTHTNDVGRLGKKAFSIYSTMPRTPLLNHFKYFEWSPEVICIWLLFRMQTDSVPEDKSAPSDEYARIGTSLYFQRCIAALLAVVPCVFAFLTSHISPREPLTGCGTAELKMPGWLLKPISENTHNTCLQCKYVLVPDVKFFPIIGPDGRWSTFSKSSTFLQSFKGLVRWCIVEVFFILCRYTEKWKLCSTS